jgi:hypothetical protein
MTVHVEFRFEAPLQIAKPPTSLGPLDGKANAKPAATGPRIKTRHGRLAGQGGAAAGDSDALMGRVREKPATRCKGHGGRVDPKEEFTVQDKEPSFSRPAGRSSTGRSVRRGDFTEISRFSCR